MSERPSETGWYWLDSGDPEPTCVAVWQSSRTGDLVWMAFWIGLDEPVPLDRLYEGPGEHVLRWERVRGEAPADDERLREIVARWNGMEYEGKAIVDIAHLLDREAYQATEIERLTALAVSSTDEGTHYYFRDQCKAQAKEIERLRTGIKERDKPRGLYCGSCGRQIIGMGDSPGMDHRDDCATKTHPLDLEITPPVAVGDEANDD